MILGSELQRGVPTDAGVGVLEEEKPLGAFLAKGFGSSHLVNGPQMKLYSRSKRGVEVGG